MSMSKWKVVRELSRKLGPVWVVVCNKDGKKQKGYFKFATKKNKKYAGPLLANELISYCLGKMLNLNIAEIELTRIRGRLGIVSIVQPASIHYNWIQLSNKLNEPIIKHIDDPEQLLKTFVFDIWICNVDRHGGNIITFPVGDKYSFYLIDHGLALLGAMRWRRVPWYSPYWNHVAKYNRHYVRGLRSYIYSYQQVSPFVKQIQSIPTHEINRVVESVPASILSERNKEIVKKLLLKRQNNLDEIINLWIEQNEKLIIPRVLDIESNRTESRNVRSD